MHSICEVILPPDVNDVEAAVKQVLEPFYEGLEDADCPFWDFWTIGGRFAGYKAETNLDREKLDQFYDWLKQEKVSVSGLQCGKQELQPASQEHKVDAKWSEMFEPGGVITKCPLFRHSNDQYSEHLNGDIGPVGDYPNATAERLIVAVHKRDYEKEVSLPDVKAEYMLARSIWNGTTHQDTKWNGKLTSAIEEYNKRVESYADWFREINTVTDDWIAVTVDYHS